MKNERNKKMAKAAIEAALSQSFEAFQQRPGTGEFGQLLQSALLYQDHRDVIEQMKDNFSIADLDRAAEKRLDDWESMLTNVAVKAAIDATRAEAKTKQTKPNAS